MPDSRRLTAVDALRGLAIVGMLAVNLATPAVRAAVPQVQHAGWTGVHLADAVFPAFLVAAGCALGLGTAPRPARLARRVGVLFALGVALNLLDGATLETVRVMGVLQRIALAYGIAAVVVRRGGPAAWALGAAALAGAHWALLVWPLGGASSLTPGRGVAAAVDRTVLGSSHSHLGAVPDPEGLLGTLSAAATVLLGALAVRVLQQRHGTALLALAGAGAVGAGVGWATLLAVGKPLWTPSYALLTAGITVLVLVVLRLLERPADGALLAPAAVLGRNALAVYVVTEAARRLARRPWGGDGTSPIDQLASAGTDLTGSPVAGGWVVVLAFLALGAAVAGLLARRRITLTA